MNILDIGCGIAKTKNAIGLDCVQLDGVDVVHDLNSFPWPFADESFDLIVMNDVIEHLSDTIKVMEEVYRLLRVNGKVKIRVVYWNHKHAYSDPTHVRFFTEDTWDFFTNNKRAYYSSAQFELGHFEYLYDLGAKRIFHSEKIMKKLSNFFCNIISGMKVELIKK